MNGQKKGFTLIELLVVVSIIALLVSILLPALNRSRQQAKQVVCAARLQQVGVALTTYALQDQSDRFPVSNGFKLQVIPYDMYEVLKSITPDTPEILVCPSNSLHARLETKDIEDPNVTKIYRWEPFPVGYEDSMQIGYYYIGGRDLSTWDWRFIPPDANPWISPVKFSDPPHLPVMADIIDQAIGRVFWLEVVHRPGGYIKKLYPTFPPEPEAVDTEGGNSLRLDGSVVWSHMNQMQKYPRSRPGQYRSYGYWDWDH
jgi:prepilin-type N-terminal cleavage/methylation domain-containing protein